MPNANSADSSTEHWTKTPGDPTAAPIETATAFDGASPATGTVVSSSRKPKAAAVAASAASKSGSSDRLVTCAWLLGVRRARIFVIAITSSAALNNERTAANFAGVMPEESRTMSARE